MTTTAQTTSNDPNDRPVTSTTGAAQPALGGEAGLGRLRSIPIVTIAAICHAANAELCRQYGDASQPDWRAAPLWQQQSAVNGVRKIAAGEVTAPQQSHLSWSAEKLDDGWVYGPVKDAEKKTHPCLVPFEELPLDQQAKDHLFFSIATGLLGL